MRFGFYFKNMNEIIVLLSPFLEEWPLITAVVIVAIAGLSVFYSFLKKERVFLQREIEHVKDSMNQKTESLKDSMNQKIESVNQKIDSVKDSMNQKIESLGKEIGHVKELLSNHVTDTNKKIDKLEDNVRELRDGQTKLESKIDRLLEKQ